jgi:KaiC/GvpD/RAD55 family RecA-like ATPase
MGTSMDELHSVTMPTGIISLDSVMKGGFPAGSFVLLLGEIGAGNAEFAYTSVLSLLELHQNGKFSGAFGNSTLPEKICYISLTRSWEDVHDEIRRGFPEDLYEISDKIDFKDFSEEYFSRSSVPTEWVTEPTLTFDSLREKVSGKGLISEMVAYLDENAPKSVVIIDSVTTLAEYCANPEHSADWPDLISFFRGLQKISKEWGGIVYALLTAGILDSSLQEQVLDCADGVLIFEWDDFGETKRQRVMHVKKFRGLLPQLERANLVKFETSVTIDHGFAISKVKQVGWQR